MEKQNIILDYKKSVNIKKLHAELETLLEETELLEWEDLRETFKECEVDFSKKK